MSDGFASPTKINMHGDGFGIAEYGDDSKQVCIFYWKSVRNEAKSRDQNKPIFENVVYVRMHPPGERLNIIDRPASENDKHRFPRPWNQFVRNKTQVPEGTPIQMLYPNNPAYADMLQAQGIYTIQQASNLSANAIDSIGMGAQEVVNKAQRFLTQSTDSMAFNKLVEENKTKDTRIAGLERLLGEQKKQIDALAERIGLRPTEAELNPVGLVDSQIDRINANHITSQITTKKSRKSKKEVEAPPREELDQYNQLLMEEIPEDEPFDIQL